MWIISQENCQKIGKKEQVPRSCIGQEHCTWEEMNYVLENWNMAGKENEWHPVRQRSPLGPSPWGKVGHVINLGLHLKVKSGKIFLQ